MKTEVISIDTIKPTSPTPHHLRHYSLSFLDQISPPIYMPLLFFFAADPSAAAADFHGRLKHSLSDTLTRFYPLAGHVRDNSFIDCNDAGVPFSAARAPSDSRLDDVVRAAAAADLDNLIPRKPDDFADGGGALAVRVTVFGCGGVALGLSFSHKAADALSMVTFLRDWTAAARGSRGLTPPQFGSAELFPGRIVSGYTQRTGIIKENIATRRYAFDAAAVESLRVRAKFSDSKVLQRRPTRVEALSAFIWTRFMAATRSEAEPGSGSTYTVQQVVNLRPRMEPPLREDSFGNYYRIAVATPPSAAGEARVVREMRSAIGRMDSEYVRRVREGDEHLKFVKDRAEKAAKGEVVSFTFTSLCRFPLYEAADFGWGRLVWVASAGMPYRNLVSFLDSRSGGGIDAWVHLEMEDMAKLGADKEFLSFVSPVPGG